MHEEKTPLSDWVKKHSQTKLANLTGLTQGGIRKMLISDRNIFVVEKDSGSIELVEIKKLGNSVNQQETDAA